MAGEPPLRELIEKRLRDGVALRQRLGAESVGPLLQAAGLIVASFRQGGKLLLFGNGGSAADAQHIAAEFVCRFSRNREAMPALALTTDTSTLTAVSNDYGFEQVFARQISALARAADVVLAISTSGASRNVLAGLAAARQRGLQTIVMTGESGKAMASAAHAALVVPSNDTALVQECHITFGHLLCECVEALFLGQESRPAPYRATAEGT